MFSCVMVVLMFIYTKSDQLDSLEEYQNLQKVMNQLQDEKEAYRQRTITRRLALQALNTFSKVSLPGHKDWKYNVRYV